jgi:hypothetical protein
VIGVLLNYKDDSMDYSPSRMPVISHVNREARRETLRFYSLNLGAQARAQNLWWNPMLDTIRFFEGNGKIHHWFCA